MGTCWFASFAILKSELSNYIKALVLGYLYTTDLSRHMWMNSICVGNLARKMVEHKSRDASVMTKYIQIVSLGMKDLQSSKAQQINVTLTIINLGFIQGIYFDK